MSNPGVVYLATNQKFGLKIEDNIGEAIHLHYQNIRLDLTVAEFENLAECMNDVIDEIIGITNFSCKNIKPEDLVKISAYLTKIKKAEKDEIFLKDILINTNGNRYLPIIKHKVSEVLAEATDSSEEQIILFGNTNFVICGHEKCLSLFKTHTDKIPITRLYFDKTVKIKDFQSKEQRPLIKKVFKIIKWIIRYIKNSIMKIYKIKN